MSTSHRSGVTIRAALAVLAATALLATACGGSEPASTPAPATPAPSAPAAPAQPETGGTLIVDSRFGHRSPDPHRDGTAESRKVFVLAYDSLTTFTSADVSTPEPGLAVSWSANADATEWTFVLRDGAVFEDGTPVTVDDVVFSLRRFKNIKGPFSFLLNGVTIEAGSGNSVVLRTEQSNVAMPFFVSYPKMAVVPAAKVRAAGGTDAEDAAETDKAESLFEARSLGTGPYVLSRFSLTGQVEFTANPNYWGAAPKFDQIVLVESDSQTQLLNIQSGRADIALDLSTDQLGALNPAGLTVATGVGPVVWYLFMNLSPDVSSVTSQRDLREAVRYALDYDAIGELFGPGAPRACGIVPSMVLGALDQSECVTQDLDRARAALARTGIANPTITLEYIADFATDGVSHGTVSERIQRQLAAVGITANLISSPLATQLDRYRSATTEAHFFTVSMRHPDVSSYVIAFSDGGGNATPAGLTRATMPTAQALADRILASRSDSQREPLVREWQRILNEEGPYVTLFQSTRTVVTKAEIAGVETHPLYLVDLRNAARG
jgi:peptide/nickel transport system substrate-binding protein